MNILQFLLFHVQNTVECPKTGSMRLRKFLYLHTRDALQIQICISWEALCVKMQDFCINVIPVRISQ